MTTEDYTWEEFKDEVRSLMPLNNDHLAIQDSEDGADGFLTKMIRQAVIELQDLIPAYRKGHETLYYEFDFAREGEASVGVFPPQGQVRELWLFNLDTKARHPVVEFPWTKRFELVNAYVVLPDQQGRFTYESGGKFYLYPVLATPWVLSVVWDGLKLDFIDAERVPFTEATALCVADYASSRVEREINRNLAVAESYKNDYLNKRRALYRTEKERVA